MVSIDMLVEHLKLPVLIRPGSKDVRYEFIRFLQPEDMLLAKILTRDEEMSSICTLFCGDVSQCVEFLTENPGNHVLCVCPDDSLPQELLDHADYVLAVQTSDSPRKVFLDAEHLIIRISSWVKTMRSRLLDSCSFNDLLQTSRDILPYFIAITNSEFELLGHSDPSLTNDPHAAELVAKGHHGHEAIQEFRRLALDDQWVRQTGTVVRQPSSFNPCAILDYVYHMEGIYFLHITLNCGDSQPTQGLLDTFGVLIEHMRYLASRSWEIYRPNYKGIAQVFEELRRCSHVTPSLTRQLADLGIPEKGDFVLLGFVFGESVGPHSLDPYHINYLQSLFPCCFVGELEGRVLFLSAEAGFLEKREEEVLQFMAKHHCTASCSNPFEVIEDFRLALQQVEVAHEIRGSKTCDGQEIFYFKDSLLEYIIKSALENSELVKYSARGGLVERIADFDAEHGTEDLRLLYSYLINERKVSTVCDELFVSRSTLLYRIRKMQERFGFDLDHPTTRTQLVLEFIIKGYDPRS